MSDMSTVTLKDAIYNNYAADSAEKAIELLYSGKCYGVILYSRSRGALDQMCKDVYAEIKKRNVEIPTIDDQMLPVHPYYFDAVYECLPTHCAEISMGPFKEKAGGIYIFSEPNYSVLTDPEARKPYSSKAMTTLAMLGYMMSGGR